MAIEEFQTSLPMMLIRALDHIMPKFRTIFKQFGITEQQARVVRILWQYKKVSFSNPGHAFNLAERLNKMFDKKISELWFEYEF